MKVIGSRPQRTLAKLVSIKGIGFIAGDAVEVRLLPASENTGVHFQRTDLRNAQPIPARVESVTGTERRTTLGFGNNQVTLVEHLLSALAGLRVDNCRIELNASEPPGLDGSSKEFVDAILSAGIVCQKATRNIWTPHSPIRVASNGATLTLHPGTDSSLKMSYFLHYGQRSPIVSQVHTSRIDPNTYGGSLASSRTFVLEEEAKLLRAQGIGLHLRHQDLLIFGKQGPIQNPLRFADEPARHKILDMVGDLSLCGLELAGHVVAYRSGHPLNVELARKMAQSLQAKARRAA